MKDNYLGENLRKIRKLYERKQTDVAAYIGLSTRQYSKMENDEIPIKDKYLLKLADCYGITIAILREFNPTQVLQKSVRSPAQDATELHALTYEEQRTSSHYEELLAAKENIIKSQGEFIAFLSKKIKEQP